MTWRSSSNRYLEWIHRGGPGNGRRGESAVRLGSGGRRGRLGALSRVELILDGSGSMKEKNGLIDGKLKIDVAKEVLAEVVPRLPAGIEVALRVSGHRVREGQRGACQDSELASPSGPPAVEQILQRIAGIQALGTTPIAYSLEQAAKDFGTESRERMVVLITDGKEECGGDPVQAVGRLAAAGAIRASTSSASPSPTSRPSSRCAGPRPSRAVTSSTRRTAAG